MNWTKLKYTIQDFGIRGFIVDYILNVKFIVNDNREFGVRVLGINFYYYKRSTPLTYKRNSHDDGKSMLWREVSQREFGESLISPYNFESSGKDPDYGEEYKLNEQWELFERYPLPKYIIERIKRSYR